MSVALPSGILPDKCGNSLLLQASRFEKKAKLPHRCRTRRKNGQFYKIYTAGYMLGSVEKVFHRRHRVEVYRAFMRAFFGVFDIFDAFVVFTQEKSTFCAGRIFYVSEPCKSVFFSASGYVGTMLFMSLFLFVMFIKTDYFFEMVSCVAHIGVYVCGFAVFCA
ncbi:MAG: hypothetical protein L6V93_14365 [Clostridiales bacterium]|nr:MAG: hypothetical protein L6V93_14365 [Clostridiales bacterium]